MVAGGDPDSWHPSFRKRHYRRSKDVIQAFRKCHYRPLKKKKDIIQALVQASFQTALQAPFSGAPATPFKRSLSTI